MYLVVHSPDATDNSKSASKKDGKQDASNETPGENAEKNDKSSGNDSNQDGPQKDSKDGKQQEATLRVTDVFHKVDGKWKLIHSHVSVPVDPKTGQGQMNIKS